MNFTESQLVQSLNQLFPQRISAGLHRLFTRNDEAMVTGAGAGITSGTGTVYRNSVSRANGIITTSILIDLTGLASSFDFYIIGVGSIAARIGQITTARNGTILAVRMTCLELPAGGADDIDLYSATEGTGTHADNITDLTETVLITSGAAWASGMVRASTGVPANGEYLYLTSGETVVGTYTAGKFLIELFGYEA